MPTATTAAPVAVLASLPGDNTYAIDPPSSRPANVVNAVPIANNRITLNWAVRQDDGPYHIYSDMGTGYGVYLYKAETQQPIFIDKTLRSGTDYRYRVTQVSAQQEVVLAQASSTTLDDNAVAVDMLTDLTLETNAALPADAVLLGLISHHSFTDNFNTLTIVGEARNDSTLNVGQTNLTITFYDSAGTLIDTAQGETILDVIQPGEMSPFIITVPRPDGMASYSLRAVARPVAARQTAQLSVIELRRYEDGAGFLHIRGTIKNTGNLTAQRVKTAAVIYGRGYNVINVGVVSVNPPSIEPGQTATYDVTFTYYPRYAYQTVIPFEE